MALMEAHEQAVVSGPDRRFFVRAVEGALYARRPARLHLREGALQTRPDDVGTDRPRSGLREVLRIRGGCPFVPLLEGCELAIGQMLLPL